MPSFQSGRPSHRRHRCTSTYVLAARDVRLDGSFIPVGTEERKYAKNVNGKSSTRDSGNGYFFMCAIIPVGRLTLVNFGARYGQSYQIVLVGWACSRSS